MSKEIKMPSLFASEEIPCMLFADSKDADEFDNVLREYVNNKDSLNEFREAERGLASLSAVLYYIDIVKFHHRLKGDYSDNLIAVAENMVDTYGEDIEKGDCYTPVMNYIFHKLHPSVVRECC